MKSIKELLSIKKWEDIHKDFTKYPQLKKNWEQNKFTYQEVKSWIEKNLKPDEYIFAHYLKKDGYQPADLNENNLEELRKKCTWQDIHQDFYFWIRKEWEEKGFNHDETKSWIELDFFPWNLNKVLNWKKEFTPEKTKEFIELGLNTEEIDFAKYLKQNNIQLAQLTTANLFQLRKNGLCKECNQPNTGEQWCKYCNAKRFEKNFVNWTSGSQEVDAFIQKYQLEATDSSEMLEWIPHEQINDIKYLAEGGFSKVYKAKWNNKEVALKILNNSSNIKRNFLQEIANHKLTGKSLVVPCYGISQDPETKNYLMIMQYMPDGNLRQYLNNNYSELSFRDNLSQLVDIVRGLNKIHRQGLIHKDLHPGNILMDNTNCYITDLGLCQPVGEASQENIYGVLPYVAPEILRRQTYTQVADIYSFGIIACEILSGCPPYLVYNKRTNCYEEIPHDAHLALKICDELRPEFAHSIMISVIDKCLDSNPSSRPTANEIAEILSSWCNKIDDGEDENFFLQCQEAEEFNFTRQTHKANQSCSQNTYTSKLLDFGDLSQPKNSKETNNLFYKTRQQELTLGIAEDNNNREQLKNAQEEFIQSQQTAQILQTNPPNFKKVKLKT